MKQTLKLFFIISFLFFVGCRNNNNEPSSRQIDSGGGVTETQEMKDKIEETQAENKAQNQLLQQKNDTLKKKVTQQQKAIKEVQEKLETHEGKVKEHDIKVSKHDEDIHETKQKVNDVNDKAEYAHKTAIDAKNTAKKTEQKVNKAKKESKPSKTVSKTTTTTVETKPSGAEDECFKVGKAELCPILSFNGSPSEQLSSILKAWMKDTKYELGADKTTYGRSLRLSFENKGDKEKDVHLHSITFTGLDNGVLDKDHFMPECELKIDRKKVQFGLGGKDIYKRVGGGPLRRTGTDNDELSMRVYFSSSEIKSIINNVHEKYPKHSSAKEVKNHLDNNEHKVAAEKLKNSKSLASKILEHIFVGTTVTIKINNIEKTYKITSINADNTFALEVQ